MNKRITPKPTWGTLYSFGAMAMAALFFVPSLHTTHTMQTIMMLLIVAALYGATAMWISANSYALVMEKSDDTNFVIHWDVARKPEEVTTSHSTSTTDTPDHQEVA